MTQKFLLAAIACLTFAGGDSSATQTVTRGLPVAPKVEAIETISTAISFIFPQAALAQAGYVKASYDELSAELRLAKALGVDLAGQLCGR